MEAYFVLDDSGQPRQELDIDAWEQWFATADRGIARTTVSPEVTVLTTFRGVVDLIAPDDRPRLFETRVFGGVLDAEEVEHYTRDDSLAAHDSLSEWCRIGNARDADVTEELDGHAA